MQLRPTRLRAPRGLAAVTALVLVGAGAQLLVAQPAAAALPAPVPVGNSQGKEIRLDWQPVPGATGYVVQVGVDENWSDDPVLELSTVATRLTLPVWLPHADYLWRVAAVQDKVRGRWSTSGAATTFTRAWPQQARPLTPASEREVPATDRPTFSWTPVPTASEYQLQVSNAPTFDGRPLGETQVQNPVTDTCFTTRTTVTPFTSQASARNASAGGCSFTLPPSPGGQYYWRVRPLDQVAGEVKEVVTTPVVDEGISNRPPPPKPLDLDTKACPTEPTSPEGLLDPCEPENEVEKGSWSVTTPFRYPGYQPAEAEQPFRELAPVPVHPLPTTGICNAAAVCSDFPTLSWTRVPGASSYRVYVALDPAFSNIQEIVDTRGAQWTPTAQWRQGTVGRSFSYVVQPCTSAGCGTVSPSAATSFRLSSPAVTGLAATVTRDEVLLRWDDFAATLASRAGKATSEAHAYRVQVTRADNPDFQAPLVDEATVDATSHVSPTRRYGDGEFLWRVQAIDASGHKLPWSAPRRFTRDATRPQVTRVSPAASVDAAGSVSVRFSEPVTGVSGQSVVLKAGGRALPVRVTQPESGLVVLDPAAPLLPGASYVLSVSDAVRDRNGNPIVPTSAPITVSRLADDASPVFRYTGRWARAQASDAKAGTFSVASRPAAVSFSVYGTGFALGSCSGAASGRFEVRVDGVLRVRGDAYRPYSRCGTMAVVPGLSRGRHEVKITVLGTRRPASRGTSVGVDALRVFG